MTVFKGYLLMMKRNWKILILYLFLFLALTLLIQKFMGDDDSLYDGTDVRLHVAVIDRDQSELSRAFTKWLGSRHELIDVPDDQSELQEEMYYGNLDYIVYLPKGFEDQITEEAEPLDVVEKPGSYQSVFVRAQISEYLCAVRTFAGCGYTLKEAASMAAEQDDLAQDVTVVDRNGHGGETPGYITMFKYLSYLYIAVLCYCLGTVILIMRDREIRRRIQCSCVSAASQNLQTLLACLCAGVFLWLISLALIFAMYGRSLAADPHLPWLMLASFLMMFDGLAIAFLVGNVAPTAGVINSIVNVAAMGMCFLCGVFIPMSMLSGVRPLSRLLPVYWFVTALELLGDYKTLDAEMYRTLFTAYGIQLFTALLLFAIALLIRKSRTRER